MTLHACAGSFSLIKAAACILHTILSFKMPVCTPRPGRAGVGGGGGGHLLRPHSPASGPAPALVASGDFERSHGGGDRAPLEGSAWAAPQARAVWAGAGVCGVDVWAAVCEHLCMTMGDMHTCVY